MNDHGFVPIFVLLIAGVAAAFMVGAKVQQTQIEQTMICHAPEVHHEEPSEYPVWK